MEFRHAIDECWRLGLVVLVAVIAGLLTGRPAAFVIGFLVIYALWMIYRFHELVLWLKQGGKKKRAPDTSGIASEVVQLVHRDRKSRTRQKNRLLNSLTQFNDMAAELPDATVVFDQVEQIRWCNRAAEQLLGLANGRDRGQRINNLIRSPEFLAFLAQEDPSVEVEMVSPTNPQLTLSLRCVDGGNKLRILTATDITQRVQIREMRKAFVADVSHELRTPLTVIQGYLEMLLEDGEIPDHALNALSQVKGQSDRMTEIVNDLLTLSKLESSALSDHDEQPVRVAGIAESIVRDASTNSKNNHTFETDIETDLIINASEKEIFSACQNLVQNAVRYATPGTTITVTWKRDAQDRAVFSVSDEGPGIDPAHLARLTERFYRVDKGRSRDVGGTGLGLAIVKYIAQRHASQLEIASEIGTGSTFSLVFPSMRVSHSHEANVKTALR